MKLNTKYLSENPINSPDADLFGFHNIAVNLSRSIKEIDINNSSFIMGIYGEWGVGKTSLVNLLKKNIENEASNQYVFVDFDAWAFRNETQLYQQFFIQLGNAIKTADSSKKHKNLAKHIFEIGIFSLSTIDSSPITQILLWAKKYFFKSNDDIKSIKNKISNELKKIDKKLLIVIDNIDRLHRDEICQVIKLVAFMSELPNLIFILPFDKQKVEKALSIMQLVNRNELNNSYIYRSELDELTNADYLDKLINIEFYMPKIKKHELRFYIESQLETFDPEDTEKAFGEELDFAYKNHKPLFGEDGLINHFLIDARVAKKYFNTLRFLLNETIKKELDVPDFMTMTFLQMFLPDLYKKIRRNKKCLTARVHNINSNILNELKAFHGFGHTEYASKLGKNYNVLDDLLKNLFPIISISYDINKQYDDSKDDSKIIISKFKDDYSKAKSGHYEKRICNDELFGLYFQYGSNSDEYYDEKTMCTICDYNCNVQSGKHLGIVAWSLAKSVNNESKNYIEARCESCNGLHYKCKECDYITAVDDLSERKCYSCNLSFN